MDALVIELETNWKEAASPRGRKLTLGAALDIVRRVGEGLDTARALLPWRISPRELRAYEDRADEGAEPYTTFLHYFARAQNVLRGRLLNDIANGEDIKAKIDLLKSTTPEFAPAPTETVFNVRPQFRGALESSKTVVNLLPELPPYEVTVHASNGAPSKGVDSDRPGDDDSKPIRSPGDSPIERLENDGHQLGGPSGKKVKPSRGPLGD